MKNDTDSIAKLNKKIKQLEEKNQELNNIIFKAPIPIFVVDKNHTITHFNQALEELSGLSAKDMLNTKKQWKAFYSSERPIMADLIVDNASDNQIIEQYGLKYKKSSTNQGRFAATDFFPDLGDEGKWLFFTASAFSDNNGDITGAVETLQDVTEEKRAEEKAKELYRIHRKILEFVPYPIIVYNENGWVSYANPSFSKTFGWTLDEIKGKPLLFVPKELEAETNNVLNTFMENKSLTRYETQRLTKQGKILDVVLWAASHSKSKTGDTEHFVILRDITEEKRLAANNKTIMRISAVLPEYPELEDLMTYIAKEVKALLKTEGALVLLYDEIKEELFYAGGDYDDSEVQKKSHAFRFPVDSVVAGQIIKTGEYAMINDAQKSIKDQHKRDEKLGYKTKSLLEVPIKSEDRIIGVLCAVNKKQNLFDYNDMELMTMIASTCAISIENARFSEAVREAYLDVASMNRAKGKAINHLSHELKTPVAILTGSLQILKKKLASIEGINVDSALNRIERNLDRVVDIQDEVADIMEDKTYSAQQLLLKMFEACQDELETLVLQNLDSTNLEESVRQLIDEKFGPRSIHLSSIDLSDYFNKFYARLLPEFSFRDIHITLSIENNLPKILLPREILDKMIGGLIKNAIENTPEKGEINISITKETKGILFSIHDFGVGIEEDSKKRIFEGFFTTQESLLYSTKKPFAFNAGGKGADLLRMKIFSDRHGFTLDMESQRCCFLFKDKNEICPGDIRECKFCKSTTDCLNSGHSIFTVFFPFEKN